MRVTNRLLYSQLVKDLGNSSEKLLQLNKKVSSGKRINAPSDDPLGMASVLSYRTELNGLGQYQKAITYANGWLSKTDSILQDMDDLMGRATELATQGASSTATADTRLGAAEEVKQIREMMLGHANSKYGNKYMFGGTLTQTQPFLDVDVTKWQDDVATIADLPAAPAEGTSAVVQATGDLYVYTNGQWKDSYQGNDSTFSIQIGKGDSVQTNIPGSTVFTNSAGNIFMTLMKFEKALRSNDQTGIKNSITDINSSSMVISNNLAGVGAILNRLDHTASVIDSATVANKASTSKIEDLDYAEGITSLQNQQTIYQAALKSASMITSLSLVDYITS